MGLAALIKNGNRNNRVNYLVRQGISFSAFLIHISLFYGQFTQVLLLFALFQGLLYPLLLSVLPVFHRNPKWTLYLDNIIFGICIALWGFNPFLFAISFASVSMINLAAGGWRFFTRGVALVIFGAVLGVIWQEPSFRPELSQITVLLGSFGLLLLMISFGIRVYKIINRMRAVRNDLQCQSDRLRRMNALALAVNSSLDQDVIMKSVVQTLESVYPFEAFYILSLEEDKKQLEVTGIYGSGISSEEHLAFEGFKFDTDRDQDSIFVKALQQRNVIYISEMTPKDAREAAPADRALYAIKASVSIAYFPIYVQDKVVAGALLTNYERHFYLTDGDIDQIQDYLIQVGTAVRNAKLFKELTKAKEQAEASEGAKGRFLANMSHEIRTPMTAILGYADILREEPNTKQDRLEAIGHIVRGGKHLLSTINNILDISKIDANKINVERISCSLLDIICDMNSYMGIKCKEKSLDYDYQVTYPFPSIIHSDPTRLKQILLNLCDNAVKFTQAGSVRLTFALTDGDTLVCQVIDTGIGIDETEIKKVFSAFDQADTSTTRLYGGSGLGLYISKNLAHLLGGDLHVDSTKGRGSQFTLNVPVGPIEPSDLIYDSESLQLSLVQVKESKAYVGVPQLEGRILIAEDNPENQKLISRLIRQTGIKVDLVENGEQAVQAALSQPYDGIFMDMQMPRLSGCDAAQKLEAAGNTTPMVAFTANVMKHQVEQYQQMGFIEVLEKPIIRSKLFALLSKLTSKKNTPSSMQVLIAEDNEVNQLILSSYVTKAHPNAQVTLVKDGLEAVTQTEQHRFDLILMDMEMPEMDGLKATRKIRAQGHDTPLYIVTGNIQKSDIARCLASGASGHLAKPLDREQINQIIADALKEPLPNC